jgi:hypothetical protein
MPDIEVPEEDAAEQMREVAEVDRLVPVEPRTDVDDGDLAESAVEVPLDDEDYR